MNVNHLSIGGLGISISSADGAIACRFEGADARFLTDAIDEPDVRLTVRAMNGKVPRRGGELVFDSGAVWRLFRSTDGFRIECSTEFFGAEPYKIATFDSTFSQGEIALRTEATGVLINPLAYPLDEVLVSHLLGHGRGVELHSCGLVDRDGRGHLFVGQSGAGKSTTARLWEPDGVQVLSDDRIIIRETESGMRMFGSPWHGEAMLSSPGSAELAGIYLLQQAGQTELRTLSPSEAVARLFTCAFPLFHDASALAFTVAFFEKIVEAVPVRELRFTPDRSAVDAVRSAA